MTSKIRRITALVMSVVLILALFAGCGKDTGSNDSSGDKAQSGTNDKKDKDNKKDNEPAENTYVYKAEYTSFPKSINYINTILATDDCIFFNGEEQGSPYRTFYDANWVEIASVEIDESEMTTYYGYKETEDEPVTPPARLQSDPTPDGEIHYDAQGNELKYNAALDIYYFDYSDYYSYEQVIYKMDYDCKNIEKLPDFKITSLEADGGNSNVYLDSIAVDNDGNIWILESGSKYHYDDNGQYIWDGEFTFMRKLTATGAEAAKVDLSVYSGNGEYVYYRSMAFDAANNLFTVDDGNNIVMIFDPDGTLKGNIEMGENWVNDLISVGGVVYARYWGDNGMVMTPLDANTFTTGEPVTAPANANSIYPASDYDFCYDDQNDLYGYNIAAGTSEKIINWIDSDVNANYLRTVLPGKDGVIYAVSQNYDSYNDGMAIEMIKFTKVPASEMPVKTVLELACVYLDYNLRTSIINFNKTNDKYRISVNDYSAFNTEDDYNAAVTKLSAEIISGDVPDIIMLENLPYGTYESKGLLEDLYPYLKNDAELSDNIMYEAFKPIETEDGKLFAIADGYYLNTLVGAASVVGDKMGWTIKDLQAALGNMPAGATAFDETYTRDQLIRSLCRFAMTDYIDWETGRCDFSDQGFKDFLTYIASYPETFDWDTYYGDNYNYETDSPEAKVFAGKVMLMEHSIYDLWTYSYLQAMFHNKPFTFVGYPTTHGNGSTIDYSNLMAMSTTCADKEGAWQFMRNILTTDYQTTNVWHMRVNKEAFMKDFESMSKPYTYIDENGEEVTMPNTQYIAGFEIEVDIMTQADLDKMLAAVAASTAVVNYDEQIYQIIIEESAAFFNGQKSVDDVCSVIQSRVGIYISENM